MNLQREKVVIIKRGLYEEPTGVLDLPKRDTYLVIPPIHNAHLDERAVPSQRRSPEFPRWVTHMAVLELFTLQTDHNWLLVLEDHVDFQSHHISILQTEAKNGVYTLTNDGSAYLIDKTTAKIIIEQNKVFYAPLSQVFQDLQKLNLIQLNTPCLLETISTINWYMYLPFFLLFIALAIMWFYMTQPVKDIIESIHNVRNAYGSPVL